MWAFYLQADLAYEPTTLGCVHRMWCILEDGSDALVGVHGFMSWVDIVIPGSWREGEFRSLVSSLNSHLSRKFRSSFMAARHPWIMDRANNIDHVVVFKEGCIRKAKRLMGYSTTTVSVGRIFVNIPFATSMVQEALRHPVTCTVVASTPTESTSRAAGKPAGGGKAWQAVAAKGCRPLFGAKPASSGASSSAACKRDVYGWLPFRLAKSAWGLSEHNCREGGEQNARYSFELFNGSNIDYRLKLDHSLGTRPCGWFYIPDTYKAVSRTISKRDIEYVIPYQLGLKFETDANRPIPMEHIRVLGFDIECLSPSGQFPKHEKAEDRIITISMCTHVLTELQIDKKENRLNLTSSTDTMNRTVFQLGDVDNEENVHEDTSMDVFGCGTSGCTNVFTFETEDKMVDSFVESFAEFDPHVVVTYNGSGFDLPYLKGRGNEALSRNLSCGHVSMQLILGIESESSRRMAGSMFASADAMTCIAKEVKTSAFGTQIRRHVVMPGRINFDLLMWFRLNSQESHYGLGPLSQKYLGRSKQDLPYYMIPVKQRTSHGRAEIARYCLVDTVLTMYLCSLKVAILMFMSMSFIQYVDISQKFMSGQQYCALSMLIREIGKRVSSGGDEFVIPEPQRETVSHVEFYDPLDEGLEDVTEDEMVEISRGGNKNVGYRGATVKESIAGVYDSIIAIMDFNSLYPTIMMAHNMCYTTSLTHVPPGWVGCTPVKQPDGKDLWELNASRDKPENYDYHVMRNKQRFCSKKHHHGLLAAMVEALVAERKEVRAMMKRTASATERVALDQRQLALKYSANSVYGALGAKVGKLPQATFIADSVTNEGRAMIDTISLVAEHDYACNGSTIKPMKGELEASFDRMRVVYGDTDSIFVEQRLDGLSPLAARKESARATTLIADYCTTLFPRPIRLEMENLADRSLLVKKKKYVMHVYDVENIEHESDGKFKVRGMSMVRRDGFRFKRNLETMMVNTLLDMSLSIEEAKRETVARVEKELARLRSGDVSLYDLIINATLSKPLEAYGVSCNIPTVCVARKIKSRNLEAAIECGTRFDILMVLRRGQSQTQKVAEYAEDVRWALTHNLRPFYNYYVSKCENVVCNFLGLIMLPEVEKEVASQQTILQSFGVVHSGHVHDRQELIEASYQRIRNRYFVSGTGQTVKRVNASMLDPNIRACPCCDAAVTVQGVQVKRAACRCTESDRANKRQAITTELDNIYKTVDATWSGDTTDIISVFSTADPNLYRHATLLRQLQCL